jgi:hypothetical protein
VKSKKKSIQTRSNTTVPLTLFEKSLNNTLMSKHRVLSFKPQLRLEWRGQDGQSETEQPDFQLTSSTRIEFSVHTGSIVVMDSLGSHKSKAVREAMRSVGAAAVPARLLARSEHNRAGLCQAQDALLRKAKPHLANEIASKANPCRKKLLGF